MSISTSNKKNQMKRRRGGIKNSTRRRRRLGLKLRVQLKLKRARYLIILVSLSKKNITITITQFIILFYQNKYFRNQVHDAAIKFIFDRPISTHINHT
jgi:hypothetical protein